MVTGVANPTVVNAYVRQKPGIFICSSALAFLIPLIIGAYWPIYSLAPDLAIAFFRPMVMGVTILLALFSWDAPLTEAETRVAGLFALLGSALLIASITATDPVRALTDWLKLMLLCGMCLLLCRALRNPSTARALGISLIVASVIIAALIVFTYLRQMGLVIPTYTAVREFKGIAIKERVPLNAVPFASVFSYVAGMCLLRRHWTLWFLGVALLLIGSVLTGSRAPVAVLVASGLGILLLSAVRSHRLVIRVIGYVAIAVLTLSICFLFFNLTFKQFSAATEGRWDLWSVALTKFTESPVLGYGYESWRDDLVSRLPGEYKLTSAIAITIAGGYHNEYLTLLAEEGLVGFFSALALVWFLLHSSWRLGFRKWATWSGGQWALFGSLFLLIRANVEVPGLFGYGQEPADFLAYIFLAIVVSRLSVEEVYLRSINRATNRLAVPSGSSNIALEPRYVTGMPNYDGSFNQ
jgi:O-antigen ligase